ncbi:hypothetical protein [Actinomadura miaoliensis]|uniref:Cell envelope biogenesis protein OmpA n=1 Tax=Actinomadura miaoliensis TaxID=430685 RepID=A0ABP7WBA2_9ACTN
MPNPPTHQIPDTVEHLPICPRRRLPVPFVNAMTPDGADFTALDPRKVYEVAERRLCGVCGRPLDYWIFLLGGPSSATERAYVDPPMHEVCARHAMQLCPYVARQSMRRRKNPLTPSTMPLGFVEKHPEAYVMYITRAYKFKVTARGLIFTPAPAVRLERYEYVDGQLTACPVSQNRPR